jgi:hypothetical protein
MCINVRHVHSPECTAMGVMPISLFVLGIVRVMAPIEPVLWSSRSAVLSAPSAGAFTGVKVRIGCALRSLLSKNAVARI